MTDQFVVVTRLDRTTNGPRNWGWVTYADSDSVATTAEEQHARSYSQKDADNVVTMLRLVAKRHAIALPIKDGRSPLKAETALNLTDPAKQAELRRNASELGIDADLVLGGVALMVGARSEGIESLASYAYRMASGALDSAASRHESHLDSVAQLDGAFGSGGTVRSKIYATEPRSLIGEGIGTTQAASVGGNRFVTPDELDTNTVGELDHERLIRDTKTFSKLKGKSVSGMMKDVKAVEKMARLSTTVGRLTTPRTFGEVTEAHWELLSERERAHLRGRYDTIARGVGAEEAGLQELTTGERDRFLVLIQEELGKLGEAGRLGSSGSTVPIPDAALTKRALGKPSKASAPVDPRKKIYRATEPEISGDSGFYRSAILLQHQGVGLTLVWAEATNAKLTKRLANRVVKCFKENVQPKGRYTGCECWGVWPMREVAVDGTPKVKKQPVEQQVEVARAAAGGILGSQLAFWRKKILDPSKVSTNRDEQLYGVGDSFKQAVENGRIAAMAWEIFR